MALPLSLIPLAFQAAPSLINLITGSDKAEAITEKVVGVVSEVTGIDVSTPDGAESAARAIEADPELLAKFTLEMRSIESDEVQALMKDRADARNRDVRIAEMNGGQNWRANVMIVCAFLVLIACVGGALWTATVDGLGEAQRTMIGSTLGTVIGFTLKALSEAFQFEFGSSRGSKEKTAQLNQVIPAIMARPEVAEAKDRIAGAFRSAR